MISTSDYYKANVNNTVTRWTPKVVIDYSDYNIDNTIAVSQSFPSDVSFPEQIADGIKTPSYKYFTWASFEWGRHLPGLSDAYEHGAVSSQISGADKTFPENTPTFYGTTFFGQEPSSLMAKFVPKPTFSVTFLERSLTSLEVAFDDKLVEYAEEFKIYVYQGTILAHTETVTGNTGTTWRKTLATQIDDVTRMDLVLDKWSVAGTWGRVLEFFTSVQETYLQDDILSLSISEETAPKKASTPIGNITANTCEVSLINRNGLFDNDNEDSPLQGNLIKNRRIMPYIGLVGDNDSTGKQIYIPLGTFYSQEWNNNNYELTAGVNGRDIVQLMAESEYKKSQFITPPADQSVSYTTTADFDAFTKFNALSANNELTFGGSRFVISSTASAFYGTSDFYGEGISSGNFYYGYATKSFTHSWTDGTSVLFQLTANETKTDADKINYQLSFDGGTTYRQIENGGLVYYPAVAGATQTVILKIEFITPSVTTALSVQDVEIDIISYVTLFSLATKVLNDFDDITNILEGNYSIESALGEITIPNAYFPPQSFRDAIELICQAGAARAYSDRSGQFVIERVNTNGEVVASRDSTSYFIAQNESNPQELINRVAVRVNPLTQAASAETIAELSEQSEASSVKTYTVFFDTDPCDTVTFSIPESGVSVTDSTIYTWGADVEITNTNVTETDFTLTVSGKPYTVRGAYEVMLDDTESIRRSGVQELSINNSLIQTEEQAIDIAELLISSYKDQKRLISADIVPDPSIEVGDGIGVDGKAYNISQQGIKYESGLLQDITGAKQ